MGRDHRRTSPVVLSLCVHLRHLSILVPLLGVVGAAEPEVPRALRLDVPLCRQMRLGPDVLGVLTPPRLDCLVTEPVAAATFATPAARQGTVPPSVALPLTPAPPAPTSLAPATPTATTMAPTTATATATAGPSAVAVAGGRPNLAPPGVTLPTLPSGPLPGPLPFAPPPVTSGAGTVAPPALPRPAPVAGGEPVRPAGLGGTTAGPAPVTLTAPTTGQSTAWSPRPPAVAATPAPLTVALAPGTGPSTMTLAPRPVTGSPAAIALDPRRPLDAALPTVFTPPPVPASALPPVSVAAATALARLRAGDESAAVQAALRALPRADLEAALARVALWEPDQVPLGDRLAGEALRRGYGDPAAIETFAPGCRRAVADHLQRRGDARCVAAYTWLVENADPDRPWSPEVEMLAGYHRARQDHAAAVRVWEWAARFSRREFLWADYDLEAARDLGHLGERTEAAAKRASAVERAQRAGDAWLAAVALTDSAREAILDGDLAAARGFLARPITGKRAAEGALIMAALDAECLFQLGELATAAERAAGVVAAYERMGRPSKPLSLGRRADDARRLMAAAAQWRAAPVRITPAVVALHGGRRHAREVRLTVETAGPDAVTVTAPAWVRVLAVTTPLSAEYRTVRYLVLRVEPAADGPLVDGRVVVCRDDQPGRPAEAVLRWRTAEEEAR